MVDENAPHRRVEEVLQWDQRTYHRTISWRQRFWDRVYKHLPLVVLLGTVMWGCALVALLSWVWVRAMTGS